METADLVDKAIALDRRIKNHTARLESCKEQLRAAARSKAKPGVKIEGQIVELVGKKGIAKVDFPKPSLIRTGFWLQGEEVWVYRNEKKTLLGRLRLATEHFKLLFRKVYKPKKDFRELCESLLTPAKSKELVEMFLEEQTPRVSFETSQLPLS